jgi:16S rRNA (cytosine967-C5)-methyltransferase
MTDSENDLTKEAPKKIQPAAKLRGVAAEILLAVVEGKSLSDVFPQGAEYVADSDRALLRELCYGTLRFYHRLAALVNPLLEKPLKNDDRDLHLLLLIGAYQLAYLRVADHVAVSMTVDAVDALDKSWARNFVNAVLRNFQRQHEELALKLKPSEQVSHTPWLFRNINAAWPEQAANIFAANNHQAPMTLRANRQHLSREDYLQQLRDAEIDATICAQSSDGITLTKAMNVQQLPGFGEGDVSVQDEAAQLASLLLNPQAGERILDACCAPGGKTCHLLEIAGNCDLMAIDNQAERLVRVEENLNRLQLGAAIVAADAGDTAQWWDGEQFDAILLDAPCSGSGVIRRHPDIKLLRRETDLAQFASEQRRLLDALWLTLKSGGRLLYATCSILPIENEQVVAGFVADNADASSSKIDLIGGIPQAHGYQMLPTINGNDGFFYALLLKS